VNGTMKAFSCELSLKVISSMSSCEVLESNKKLYHREEHSASVVLGIL